MLLHGYGSSGDDLISLAPLIQALLPSAELVAPHRAITHSEHGRGLPAVANPQLLHGTA
jgi:predicted esterase